jgi:protein-disulfide isomerase
MDVGFGPENAAVTIYEFSDFECPFCEKGARVVEQIKKTYGNKVRFVFKHLPLSFHKNAELAARAAQAANNQGKFWEMHDALFDNYRQLSPAKIDELAKGIAGMNFAKWEQDRESKAIKDKVAADKAEANRTGTRGTPNFYINGENIAGALPFETFKAKIDAALKKKGG